MCPSAHHNLRPRPPSDDHNLRRRPSDDHDLYRWCCRMMRVPSGRAGAAYRGLPRASKLICQFASGGFADGRGLVAALALERPGRVAG